MAGARVEVRKRQSGDEIIDGLLNDVGLKVRKSMDPCPECAANNDPDRVPLHPNCKCTVTLEE